jgi:hypothetical protein
MHSALRKFINGQDGRPVLWQRPNLPLTLWAAGTILSKFVLAKPWHSVLTVTASLALTAWAVLEIGWGASYFRKVVGGIVLIYTVVTRFW